MSAVDQTLFQKSDSKSDITLIVEDRKLHLNKAVLSYASPVFDRMFNGDFEEKAKDEISLPGKEYDKFVKFLQCVHPATLAEITRENIEDILPLADEYQVEQLKARCASFLDRQLKQCCENTKVNNEDLVHYMMLADNFNLKEPLETCLGIAVYRQHNHLEKCEDYKQISDATKVKLLSGRLSLIEIPAMRLHKDVTQLIGTLSSASEYFSCTQRYVTYPPGTVHVKNPDTGICNECATSICKVPLIGDLKTIHGNKTNAKQLEKAFEADQL